MKKVFLILSMLTGSCFATEYNFQFQIYHEKPVESVESETSFVPQNLNPPGNTLQNGFDVAESYSITCQNLKTCSNKFTNGARITVTSAMAKNRMTLRYSFINPEVSSSAVSSVKPNDKENVLFISKDSMKTESGIKKNPSIALTVKVNQVN